MTITLAAKLERSPDGVFAPMVPPDVWEALKHSPSGLRLYAWMQQKPAGWDFGNRERMARDSGLTVGAIRTGIRDLIAAGLYVYERLQIAAGHWITRSMIFAQRITAGHTEGSLREVGHPALIPPPREKNREGRRDHSPDDCRREAAGLACRQCAKVRGREARAEKASAPTAPAPYYRPAAEVVEPPPADLPAGPVIECEHGRRPAACVACTTGKPDRMRKVLNAARRR